MTIVKTRPNQPLEVYTDGITITATPVLTTAAYTAGDAVGTLLTFANAAKVGTGGGVLTDVVLVDDAGQDAELELWLFDTTFLATDAAAFAPAEASLHTLIGVIKSTDGVWVAAGTPSVNHIQGVVRYDCAASGTSIFGHLVCRGTPTYAAVDDLTVRIKLLQD